MVILTILFEFFSKIFSPIKAFFTNLSLKEKIAVIVFALACYGAYEVKHTVDNLKEQVVAVQKANTELTAEKAQLQKDVATAVGVNEENKKTIATMSAVQIDTKTIIADLSTKQATNLKSIEIMRNTIAKTTPADDGPIAKVLVDTINTIQANREASK